MPKLAPMIAQADFQPNSLVKVPIVAIQGYLRFNSVLKPAWSPVC